MESSNRSRHPHRHCLLAIFLFLFLFYLIGPLAFPTVSSSLLVFNRLGTFLSYYPYPFSFFFSVFSSRFNSPTVLIFVEAHNSSSSFSSSFSSSSFFHDPSNLMIFPFTSSAAFPSSPSVSQDFSFPSPPPPDSSPSSIPNQNILSSSDYSSFPNTFVTSIGQFAPPSGLSSSEISVFVLSDASSSSSQEFPLFSSFESMSNRKPRCLQTSNLATPAPGDPSQDVTIDRIWATFKTYPAWYIVFLWFVVHSFAGCCFCCWLCAQRSYQKSVSVSP